MSPWLESCGILVLLAVTGCLLPRLARTRGWGQLWLVVLAMVVLLGVLRRHPALGGRTEYVLYGPLSLLLLGLPALRTSRLPLQMLAAILAVFVCWVDSLAPFLGPALYVPPPARLNAEGVCLQPDGVSCGPAAAVTALRRLGIEANFADLARAAHTSPAIGTPPDLLCPAISTLYPVKANLIYRDRLENLPTGECLLVMNLDTWTDHYVALFRHTRSQVEVGDPLRGRVVLNRSDFEQRWCHTAILVTL